MMIRPAGSSHILVGRWLGMLRAKAASTVKGSGALGVGRMRRIRPGWLKRKSRPSEVRTSHGSASPAAAPGRCQVVSLPELLITLSDVLPSKYQLPSASCRSGFSPGAMGDVVGWVAGAVVVGLVVVGLVVVGLVEGVGESILNSSGGGTSCGSLNIFSVLSSS